MISSEEQSRASKKGTHDGLFKDKRTYFDIQRYSIHDGLGNPNDRLSEGAVLRCRWCCNPESQEYKIQTMKVLGEDKVIGRDATVEEMIQVVEKDRTYTIGVPEAD